MIIKVLKQIDMKREELRKHMNSKRYSEEVIQRSINACCPYSDKELKSGHRPTDLYCWRAACILTYWMNGETLAKAANRFNRDHSTILHYFKVITNEMSVNDYFILSSLSELIDKCDEFEEMGVKCNESQYKIETV